MMLNSMLDTYLKRMGAQEYVHLAPYSTLKVGGPARYFIEVHHQADLISLDKLSRDHEIPLHILSGGSNTLFSDRGFAGIVVKLSSQFDFITNHQDSQKLVIGAATPYAKLTKFCVNLGIPSAVGWSGVPGLVGGAVRMNAGTRIGEIGDVVEFVYGIHQEKQVIFDRESMNFSYRSTALPKESIITHVQLDFSHVSRKPELELQQKVQEYRIKRKQSQPTINSLGSFFKNPYPLFAAQLIESCHLKGLHYKGAQISSLHANFIINNGGAKANDVLHVGALAQQKVYDHSGVVLHPEVRMVGDFTDAPSIDPQRFSAA